MSNIINLDGWSLEQMSDNRQVFKKGLFILVITTHYPTMTKDGNLIVSVYNDKDYLRSFDGECAVKAAFDFVNNI